MIDLYHEDDDDFIPDGFVLDSQGRPVFVNRGGKYLKPWPRTSRGHKFVDPRDTRDRSQYEYSYSPFYLLGDHEPDSSIDYHDRMISWNRAKYDAAFKKVNRKRFGFKDWTLDDCSRFLTLYFGKPTVCTALIEGCNVSSGYPYWAFCYQTVMTKRKKKSPAKKAA